MSPFCGATDTPVLDFWWCLPWVSKPGWIPRLRGFVACVPWIPESHLWCDTCWLYRGQHGSRSRLAEVGQFCTEMSDLCWKRKTRFTCLFGQSIGTHFPRGGGECHGRQLPSGYNAHPGCEKPGVPSPIEALNFPIHQNPLLHKNLFSITHRRWLKKFRWLKMG